MYASLVAGITASLALVATATPLAEKRYETHNGPATYFYQNGGQGSCGDYHSDQDYIVAISSAAPFTYNAHCGQTVTITNTGGGDDNNGVGNVITATVADECRNEDGSQCDPNHLDLSVGAFQALTGGPLDPPGEFQISWHLN